MKEERKGKFLKKALRSQDKYQKIYSFLDTYLFSL